MNTNKQAVIKNNIFTILKNLKRSGVFRDVKVRDPKKSIFNHNFSAFPCAILAGAGTESVADTNRSNLRTYTFDIIVILKAEEVSNETQIEQMVDNILNEFDNDPTLKAGGSTSASDGAVLPATTEAEPVTVDGNNYVVFSVILKAKATRDLTFS